MEPNPQCLERFQAQMNGGSLNPVSVSSCVPTLSPTHSRRASDSAEWGCSQARAVCFFPCMILLRQPGTPGPPFFTLAWASEKADRDQMWKSTNKSHESCPLWTSTTGRFSAAHMSSETSNSYSSRTTSLPRQPLPHIKPLAAVMQPRRQPHIAPSLGHVAGGCPTPVAPWDW